MSTFMGYTREIAVFVKGVEWSNKVVLFLAGIAAIVGCTITVYQITKDDAPEPLGPEEFVLENWFGMDSEFVVDELGRRGFEVVAFPVCSSSVGAGEVRQLSSAEGAILVDQNGVTDAGQSITTGSRIEVKVGTGKACN